MQHIAHAAVAVVGPSYIWPRGRNYSGVKAATQGSELDCSIVMPYHKSVKMEVHPALIAGIVRMHIHTDV